MGVKLHIHRSGRIFTVDTAKPAPPPQRKKTHDCACQGMKDRNVRDETPGADTIRAALAIWKQSLAMTQAEVQAATPSDQPALNRILQNQTIKISQLEDELFRLEGGSHVTDRRHPAR